MIPAVMVLGFATRIVRAANPGHQTEASETKRAPERLVCPPGDSVARLLPPWADAPAGQPPSRGPVPTSSFSTLDCGDDTPCNRIDTRGPPNIRGGP